MTVTVKLIQVHVMDKSGNPITDLRPDEFTVFDNKKLQSITEFERYILFPPKDLKELQPEAINIEPLDSQAERMNRKFFLFFDLANNNSKGFQKAQEAVLHFLDNQLHPSDEVAFVSYSVLKQLTLHEYLTKDRQAIRKVVEGIGSGGRVGRAENFESLVWREMSGESALDASRPSQPIKNWKPAHLRDPGDKTITKSGYDDLWVSPKSLISNNRFKRDQYKYQVRLLFSRLIDLSKALRYIPGHKHILFFSSGVPYSAIHGIEVNNPFAPKDFGVDTFLRDKYDEMLTELSAANTTVFSFNTETLATNMNLPEHQKGEAFLRSVSKYTGGKFVGNVQNYAKGLDTVQKFTGSYYVLGYYVDESYDGHYHNIKVEVSRSGCQVFAQKGYFNPKVFSKYSSMEKELHLIDLALSERPLLQSPIDIPMKALVCPLEGEPGVCLLAQVPGTSIREKIGKEAEIYFLVFDDKDNIIELKRKVVEQSALKGKKALYYSLLPLPPGTYKTSIVMRDMQTGESAVGRNMVEIPEPVEQGLQLLPPLLLAPGKTDLYVRGYIPKSLNTGFPLLDCFPFDPELYSPILVEIPKDTQKIQAVLSCCMRNLAKPVLKFEVDLIENSSSQVRSLPVSILTGKKEGEEGTLLTELKMPELTPGEYTLRITAINISCQARSQTAVALRVY
ncbi:MAG: VWA domain-containing protein [Candidatus Aminicenantes bacterium]|nr:VWA domain-containing protein [Candidatus Aminicenantes bacterium]